MVRLAPCAFGGCDLTYWLLPAVVLGASTISYVQCNYATPQTAQTTVNVHIHGRAGGWRPECDRSRMERQLRHRVSTVTDRSGNTYTRAVGPTSQFGTVSQSIYYAKNIVAAAAGANTVTVTFSTAASNPDIRIVEYMGADPEQPGGRYGSRQR